MIFLAYDANLYDEIVIGEKRKVLRFLFQKQGKGLEDGGEKGFP